jgi:hypothetical protein
MSARQPVAGLFEPLDRHSGVRFTATFSFSLALLLLKGLYASTYRLDIITPLSQTR